MILTFRPLARPGQTVAMCTMQPRTRSPANYIQHRRRVGTRAVRSSGATAERIAIPDVVSKPARPRPIRAAVLPPAAAAAGTHFSFYHAPVRTLHYPPASRLTGILQGTFAVHDKQWLTILTLQSYQALPDTPSRPSPSRSSQCNVPKPSSHRATMRTEGTTDRSP